MRSTSGTKAPDRGRSTASASALQGLSAASWFQPGAAEPKWSFRLLRWSAFYALVGRHLGLLPYFLPLLLGFSAYGGARGRWAIPLAVLLGLAAFLVLRPFNFFGGGPYGDRYFLALYPALWFVAARPGQVLPALLAGLGAAPFLSRGAGGIAVVVKLFVDGVDWLEGRPWLPLPHDLAPGEEVTFQTEVRRPVGPAHLWIEPQLFGGLGLSKHGGPRWEGWI